MTRALSSSEQSMSGRVDPRRNSVTNLISSPPSPTLSPDDPPPLVQAHSNPPLSIQLPEPPNTPPPLAPAHLPGIPPPPLSIALSGSNSSRSSSSSTPDITYHPTYLRQHISHQPDLYSDAGSAHSQDLSYPSSQTTYASPVSEYDSHGHSGWGYGSQSDLHSEFDARERHLDSTAGSLASTPPSPAESTASQQVSRSENILREKLSYIEGVQYHLDYPDSPPVVNPSMVGHHADAQYVHPTGISQQPPSHSGPAQLSRHSIAHISPPQRHPASLAADVAPYPQQQNHHRPLYTPLSSLPPSPLHSTSHATQNHYVPIHQPRPQRAPHNYQEYIDIYSSPYGAQPDPRWDPGVGAGRGYVQ